MDHGEIIAHLKDMEAVSIESLIHAREQDWQPTEKFSLHEWTMQLILLGSPPLYRVYTFTYANHFFLCIILSLPHIPPLPRRAPRSLKELLPWE